MQKYFIRHKLKKGDYAFLSDSDSEIAIAKKLLKTEDLLEVETLDKKFVAQVVDIKPASIEIEIIKELGERDLEYKPSITIIQSLSNNSKFSYFIEKSVELGIERIIPVESEYSLRKIKDALKDLEYWDKLIKDATEQSRNVFPTNIDNPIMIRDLKRYNFSKYERICLSTEGVNHTSLKDFISNSKLSRPFIIAIGPEKGWSSSDLDIFKSMNFNFISLKGNILRTETTGLVISSIIKYLKDEI